MEEDTQATEMSIFDGGDENESEVDERKARVLRKFEVGKEKWKVGRLVEAGLFVWATSRLHPA